MKDNSIIYTFLLNVMLKTYLEHKGDKVLSAQPYWYHVSLSLKFWRRTNTHPLRAKCWEDIELRSADHFRAAYSRLRVCRADLVEEDLSYEYYVRWEVLSVFISLMEVFLSPYDSTKLIHVGRPRQ